MRKLFAKKQFAFFILSFLITFVFGFIFWDAFLNSGYVMKCLAKNFTASVLNSVSAPVEKEIFSKTSSEILEESQPKTEDQIAEIPEINRGDILDDIAEKLDIIQAQVNDLVAEKIGENKKPEENKDKDYDKEEEEEKIEEKKEEEKIQKNQTIYPKIIISETKISPVEQRFIKLYNSNSEAINLTGWYLQRKTATGTDYTTCISKNDFSEKIILPNDFFIISRSGGLANILISDLTLTENNTLVLKNPNGEISDTVLTPSETPATTNSGGGGGGGGAAKSCVGQININTASLEQLKELTGIGDVKAQAIIEVRPFSSVDDLDRVKGIGTETLQKIKEQNCAFVEEHVLPALKSIKITTLSAKTSYFVGENLDIAGLEVLGEYVYQTEDGEIPAGEEPIAITAENISGFDSSVPVENQIITITFEKFTTTFNVNILELQPATQLKIISLPQIIEINNPSNIFTVESQNSLGNLTDVLTTTRVKLSSTSETGHFSSKSVSECGDDWTKTSITISKNTAHKSFCYKDSASGIFKITVSDSAGILLSDFQDIEITTSPSNL